VESTLLKGSQLVEEGEAHALFKREFPLLKREYVRGKT
jgi:hypothetical protein